MIGFKTCSGIYLPWNRCYSIHSGSHRGSKTMQVWRPCGPGSVNESSRFATSPRPAWLGFAFRMCSVIESSWSSWPWLSELALTLIATYRGDRHRHLRELDRQNAARKDHTDVNLEQARLSMPTRGPVLLQPGTGREGFHRDAWDRIFLACSQGHSPPRPALSRGVTSPESWLGQTVRRAESV